MPMFRTAMVWLGLVDDDEYDGEDEPYYENEYDDATEVTPVAQPARAAAPRVAAAESPVTVFRGRHARAEADAPVATVPRPSAVKAIPMPTARVHVMDPRGFNDA